MERFRIYKIADNYVRYLHSRDKKVQYNKGARRPYVGVVFDFAGFQYFAPLESPKPKHRNMKSGYHFMRIENGAYGIIGFNNMIPVHKDALVEFDISKETDEKYKSLLQRQIAFCNNHKADILHRAQKTYFSFLKGNKFLCNICCDFKVLDKACKAYKKDYVPKKSK